MSLLSSIMDGLAPYIDAGVGAVGAVQRGRTAAEEIRRRDELAEQERKERRRQQMMDAALRDIQMQRGQVGLEVDRKRLEQMNTPESPRFTLGGREFDDSPEGVTAAIEWDRQINPQKYRGRQEDAPWSSSTDPQVQREMFFRENGLGVYRERPEEAPEPYAREVLSIEQAEQMVRQDPRAAEWGSEEILAGARRLMKGEPLATAAERTEHGYELPPVRARPPRRREGAPGADTAAPEVARPATAAPPARAARVRSRMNLGVHGAHATSAQQRWDELAEDARRLGLDPEEAIGYTRP